MILMIGILKNQIMKENIFQRILTKKWWKRHWDDVTLWVGTIVGLIFILKGYGVI